MIVTHEIHDSPHTFRHRLASPTAGAGLWVTFRLPAVLKTRAGTFVAVTDYWEHTEPFPDPKKIYIVKEKT